MAKVDTNSPKVRRMLFHVSPLIFLDIFGQPPRCFTGTSLLPFPSLLETDPQILGRWDCADEDHLGKYIRAKDFGLEF